MKFKEKFFILFILTSFSFLLLIIDSKSTIKIIVPIRKKNKVDIFYVAEKYKMTIQNIDKHERENINEKISDNKTIQDSVEFLQKKSIGRECLSKYLNNINSSITFNLYEEQNKNIDNIIFLKMDINSTIQLNFDANNNSRLNISYKSNHPGIIKVNNKGIVSALRPGKAIITINGLNHRINKIKVLSVPGNGLISNYTLKINNAEKFKNLMIVAHPDDETLWGGANLYKDEYFVVCLTNGYNFRRANDFRKILNLTKNRGIILDYPDLQDSIRDNWSEFKIGILKDLSTILNYNHWHKIVTHGPDGTTGHYHHKKTCEYVTVITRKLKLFNNLYYFGKFYKKNEIPKDLPRISKKELKIKMQEISLYKSVKKDINKLWFHMIPYENWILASKWGQK